MIWLILIYGSIAALTLGLLWLQKQVNELHATVITLLGICIELKANETNGKTK
jgi:hypothetical protein